MPEPKSGGWVQTNMFRFLSGMFRSGCALIITLKIFFGLRPAKFVQSRPGRRSGFREIRQHWLPNNRARRLHVAKSILSEFFSRSQWPIDLATVSGTSDLVNPYPREELLTALRPANARLRVLLAHPYSDALKQHVELDPNQDLTGVRQRIIDNTRFLLDILGEKCDVRWYLAPPSFHVLSDASITHFSPLTDGPPGHDAPRYTCDSTGSMGVAFRNWFEDQWTKALDAQHEWQWTKRNLDATRAVFLDRDDTLIEDLGYTGNVETAKIDILADVVEGLRALSEAGYRLIVVSNQQAVALKVITNDDLNILTKRIKDQFRREGVYFDAFYHCAHLEQDRCSCRKPNPGLFLRAAADFDLDLRRCHFIGDSVADAAVATTLPELTVHIVGRNNSFLDAAKSCL